MIILISKKYNPKSHNKKNISNPARNNLWHLSALKEYNKLNLKVLTQKIINGKYQHILVINKNSYKNKIIRIQ